MTGSNGISTPGRGLRAARALLALAVAMAALVSAAPARADIVSTRQYPHSGADYSIAVGSVLWWDRWDTNRVIASSYAYLRPGSRSFSGGELSTMHALFKSDGTFCADEGHSYTDPGDPLHLYKTTDFTEDVRRCGPGNYYLVTEVALLDPQGNYTTWQFQTYYLFMQ